MMNFTKEEFEEVLAKRFKMNGVIYCDNPLDEDNYVVTLSDVLSIVKAKNEDMYMVVHFKYRIYQWISKWIDEINLDESELNARVKFILKNKNDLTIYVEE